MGKVNSVGNSKVITLPSKLARRLDWDFDDKIKVLHNERLSDSVLIVANMSKDKGRLRKKTLDLLGLDNSHLRNLKGMRGTERVKMLKGRHPLQDSKPISKKRQLQHHYLRIQQHQAEIDELLSEMEALKETPENQKNK